MAKYPVIERWNCGVWQRQVVLVAYRPFMFSAQLFVCFARKFPIDKIARSWSIIRVLDEQNVANTDVTMYGISFFESISHCYIVDEHMIEAEWGHMPYLDKRQKPHAIAPSFQWNGLMDILRSRALDDNAYVEQGMVWCPISSYRKPSQHGEICDSTKIGILEASLKFIHKE